MSAFSIEVPNSGQSATGPIKAAEDHLLDRAIADGANGHIEVESCPAALGYVSCEGGWHHAVTN